MAADNDNVVSLPRPRIIEDNPAFDRLLQMVATSSDPVVASLAMIDIFAQAAIRFGVPVEEVRALAAGEVGLEAMARRHAGLLDRVAPPG